MPIEVARKKSSDNYEPLRVDKPLRESRAAGLY